ncbi:MAG TPA: hypothetical protein VGF39_09275, partial [Stellaceae bacterium]
LRRLFSGSTSPQRPPDTAPASTYTGPEVDPSLYRGVVGPTSMAGGNWAGSAAPASVRVAPPSAFTAANPQQQALWQQASTPEGYAALAARLARAAPGAVAATTPTTPAATTATTPAPAIRPSAPPYYPVGGSLAQATPMAIPPWQQAPTITGPGTQMPPAGGSQGWAGYQGRPGTQSGLAGMPPAAAQAAPLSAPTIAALKAGGMSDADIARVQGAPSVATQPPGGPYTPSWWQRLFGY